MTEGNKIRVALADDHRFITSAVRRELEADERIEVVGEANDPDGTRVLCLEKKPEIIVLDLQMGESLHPDMWDTLRFLREQCPDTKVIVLTAFSDDAYILGVLSEGVRGYVLKQEMPETILQAVLAVVAGGSWYSRKVMDKLTGVRGRSAMDHSSPEAGAGAQGMILARLTPQEVSLLKLIARGWDSEHIAREMSLVGQTVRNYSTHVYQKIGVRSRAEAIVWARENKVV